MEKKKVEAPTRAADSMVEVGGGGRRGNVRGGEGIPVEEEGGKSGGLPLLAVKSVAFEAVPSVVTGRRRIRM